MLAEKLASSGASTWLINTGWTGGGYGTGKRIDIASTRRLLSAALEGELDTAPTRTDALFGFAVPLSVEGVDKRLLTPRETWSNPAAYDRQATDLAGLFRANFEKFGEADNAAPGPSLAQAAE
jgi:phosphoenolpyruvate carboxykinase (ATP)